MNHNQTLKLAALVFAGVSTTHAAITVSENFDSYANAASVNGLNGGTGWAGAWTSNTATISNASGTAGSLVRGSVHDSNRSFTSMGTSGFQVFTWQETVGGMVNTNRRAFLRDASNTDIVAVNGLTLTSNGGTSIGLTGTETAFVALTLNYDTGTGSFASTTGSNANFVFNESTGLITSTTGTGGANIVTFSFNNTIGAANIRFSDSTIRGLDNIVFASGATAGRDVNFTTVVPEPSTYGLIGAAGLAGISLIRRRRAAK